MIKAIGTHCLNQLAYDICSVLVGNNYRLDDEEILKKILRPMASFDWSTNESPLSALGGMKGARTEYETLKNCLFPLFKSLGQE